MKKQSKNHGKALVDKSASFNKSNADNVKSTKGSAMRDMLDWFAVTEKECIQAPEDNGLVNGRIAVNTWLPEVAEFRGLYAPPRFSSNFRMAMHVNDRPVATRSYVWRPDRLVRAGGVGSLRIRTELILLREQAALLLRTEIANTSKKEAPVHIQFEIYGGVNQKEHWRFGCPVEKCHAEKQWDGKALTLRNEHGEIQFASTLKLSPYEPVRTGVLNSAEKMIPPGGRMEFCTFVSLGGQGEYDRLRKAAMADPEKFASEASEWWRARLQRLFMQLPSLESDNRRLVAYYRRSLLHLLMNEWNVPSFLLHPHYGTGSISGDTICCYMWNYGGPCRMWSLLSPKSAREHIAHLLSLDLANCYAFFADDGVAFGPYYQINHEKIVFLSYYYVMQTGDKAFLSERLSDGRKVIEHLVDQALAHDDLTKKAVLVDYGPANDHLELRSPTFGSDPSVRYNGVMPDLNLRRCPLYHLVDELCKLAGHLPPVDLSRRACDLKRLIHRKLFSAKDGWFRCLSAEGLVLFRYTIQMFKALGWGDWALEPDAQDALVQHLMADGEFLGPFGIHSLSRKDPAYFEGDVDNGGPGACVSFAAAVIERLYRDGRSEEASRILERLLWMGEALPYWGDSQRADVRDYRRVSHLQCDIEGAVPAQAIIFGLFGISVRPDFSVAISAHPFPSTRRMRLRNVRIAGVVFDVECGEKGFFVRHNGRRFSFAYGETCLLRKEAVDGGVM